MEEHDHDSIVKSVESVEDMMVDVVGVNNAGSDVVVEQVAPGLGQDLDGIRVSTPEKGEEEEGAGSGEARVLNSDKVDRDGLNSAEVSKDVVQASGSNGDVTVIDSKEVTEMHMESVEVVDGKIAESSFTAACLGSKEVQTVVVEEGFVGKDEAQGSIYVDPSIVCANNQISSTDVVNAGTSEVMKDDAQGNEAVESTSSEPQCIGGESFLIEKPEVVEQPMVCDQEVTDGDAVANENIEKENEALDTSKISEPSSTMNPGSEDVDVVVMEEGVTSKDEAQNCVFVDPSLVCPEVVNSASVAGDANVHPGNLDGNGEADKLNIKESSHLTTEDITQDAEKVENETGVQDSKLAVESLSGEPQVVGKTDLVENEETEKGLTKNEGFVEQSTVSVLEVAYENGVLDDKSVKEDEAVDTRKIPELLTTDNLGTDEVKNDADMEGGDNAGTDIDEVAGWKDEIPETDVITGAGKDDQFDVFADFEAEQGLPESSGKDKEPIVYGRRANVEVPLYDALDGSRSLVSEDENLDIETDSEEDYEYAQKEEGGQSAEHLENGSSFSLHQPRYFQPPKIEGEFAVSDLVWGKVRSHPWWPGQIVDPSDASQKAMKYYKKDRYLVAYFGDHSFAWNNPSVLKPFRANFSQIEKQTNLEAYKDAVECALEEVSRRVELGLACSCIPRDIYKKIECQVIENGGVRQKATIRHGLDESATVSSFEPDKLVDYVRLLAQFPGEGDNMDLAMAKAQLSSYGRYKGYRELPEFQLFGDLLEDAPVHEGVEEVHENVEKFENNLVESAYPNKERSLSDITDEAPESGGGTSKSVSSYALKKRKARHSISNGSLKKPKRQPEKVSTAALISTPKPSFKIGRLIQRVASQMTGPPSVLKSNSDTKVDHGQEDSQHTDQGVGSVIPLQTPETPQVEASVAEMLSQLHLTAQDPMKNYAHLHTILPFFYNRRADVYSKSLKKSLPVEKPVSDSEIKASDENDPEKFDFDDDVDNDSYWTDRIIQNTSEEQLSQDHQNGGIEYQVEASEQDEEDKPAKRRRGPYKKKVVGDEQDEEDKSAKRRRGPYKKQVVANEQDNPDEQDNPAKRRRRSKKQVVASEQDEQDKQEEQDKPAKIRRRSKKQVVASEQNDEQNKQDEQDKQEEQDKPAKIRRRSKKQAVASEQGEQDEQVKPAKRRRRSKLEKLEVMEEEEPEIVKRRRENLATEIVLKFTEGINFASVNNLNKTFRRFGPLMESETEVDKEGGRARVVFKKCSDAEVAHSSAGKFKIFGSIDVNYELNYTPLVSYRPLPLPSFQDALPLPSSQDPLPHPSFQDPLPLPSCQDPFPLPSSQDPLPHPSFQDPLPLPSCQDPFPLPSSQDPLPLPSSQDPLPLPSSQDPFPLPSSQDPLPLPSSQDPLPLPSLQEPL